mgnify:CR=1 FL=1
MSEVPAEQPGHRRRHRGLIAATALHAVAFAALALGGMRSCQQKPEPEPVVFELVDAPQARETVTASDPEPDLPRLKAPRVNPVDLPPLTEPAPEPPPQPTRAARPEPTPTPASAPTPAPAPAPTPAPARRQIDYEAFKREHGEPKPDPVRRRSPPRPSPQVDADAVARRLERMLASSDAASADASASVQQALVSYIARLRAQIERNWVRPVMAPGPWATVHINVVADGRITGHRVVEHDAPSAFLQSVDRALAETGGIGPPPGGQPIVAAYTFRLR